MKKAITVTFLFIQFIIVSLLLFAEGSTDYYLKRGQLYPNAVYVSLGLIITALLCFALQKKRTELDRFLSKYRRPVVIVTVLLFFAFSLLICIGGFFYSDWDPAAILYGVYGVLRGHPEDTGTAYFSNHPNNLLLVWIYLTVLRFMGLFGIDSVLALVVFQCLLSSLAAFIFYSILSDMTGDPVTSYLGLLLYEVWIVLSPWFIITYSDEVGIIFPLLILRLYQKMDTERSGTVRLIFLCGMLSVLAAAGYFIKPQIVISFIAVVLLYISDIKMKTLKTRAVFLISCAAFTLIFALIIKAVIIPSIGIKTDSSRSFGMTHYFMMGLNEKTDGVYSDEDTLFTDSFDSPEEKRRADMKLAEERIDTYGPWGLIDHSKRKTLVNYSDGLFAWGVDGRFFDGRTSEDFGSFPRTGMTDLIWSFIMPDGADHGKYSSFMQMIWITLLMLGLLGGIAACVFIFRKDKETAESDVIFAVMLSLTGLFVFELLFEAKARYLIIYLPYFLISAVYGTHAVTAYITHHTKKIVKD